MSNSIIRGGGASLILLGVLENFNIKVLNLGGNNIGATRANQFVDAMVKLFKEENLIHMDISHNKINKECCEAIAKALNKNHSLYGIHIEGNQCRIDARGFMEATEVTGISYSEMHLRRKSILEQGVSKVSSQNNCWICGGWAEKCIKLECSDATDSAMVHISFFDYKGMKMQKINDCYEYWCMCPPGEMSYFFTVNGEVVLNNDDKKLCNIHVKNKHINDSPGTTIISQINKAVIIPNLALLDSNYQASNKHVLPRMENGKYIVQSKKVKPPWSIPISIFKDFKSDNEALLDKCFESDWAEMKLPKLGEEEAQVKIELRKAYRLIKDNYKILSVSGRIGGIFGVEWLIYNEYVCNKISIVDGNDVKLTASDLLFKMINGRPNKGANNSQVLVRNEFLEIMLRLAIQRYYDTEKSATKAEAVSKLYSDHLVAFSGSIDPQRWRDDRYWNEECDNIYKANWELMMHLFTIRGGSKKLPGEKT